MKLTRERGRVLRGRCGGGEGMECCGPVDEMERSEEQFVKEMEVTRRNSEPASQVMALWGVGGETVVAWVFDGADERFESFGLLWV
ncbi:hypothetical protein F2Q68_00026625 [Brassica cretica]|uniref:Uncharacterized protein n=1 Tax=Brassica cretica TaxID=69181 RepID=A0A8S9IFL8_BRACR|nr:hypothetical protein F2Q68_00026625 [Brassica cretica]